MSDGTGNDNKAPDFEPPQASIGRILKAALPENVSITKDARAAFARAAGIFIFYITQCANDFCREGKRQTIFPADVINALRELEFENFVPQLEEFLENYRKEVEAKKASKKDLSSLANNNEEGEDGGEDGDVGMDE